MLAADTVVAVGRRLLLKPDTIEQAIAAIQLLSGRNHHVLTSVCLITPDDKVRHKLVDTRVRFKRLSNYEMEATSPRANGAARRADTQFRASPVRSCKNWSAPTPTSWGYR